MNWSSSFATVKPWVSVLDVDVVVDVEAVVEFVVIFGWLAAVFKIYSVQLRRRSLDADIHSVSCAL